MKERWNRFLSPKLIRSDCIGEPRLRRTSWIGRPSFASAVSALTAGQPFMNKNKVAMRNNMRYINGK